MFEVRFSSDAPKMGRAAGTIVIKGDRSLPTTPIFDSWNPYRMASTDAINLDDYAAIFLGHEVDFRQTKGAARQEVLQEIMQEMVALSEGSLNEDGMKGLYKVSQLI